MPTGAKKSVFVLGSFRDARAMSDLTASLNASFDATTLAERAFTVGWDDDRAGREVARRALTHDCAVIVTSSSTDSSAWVPEERRRFEALGKPVVEVSVDDIHDPERLQR